MPGGDRTGPMGMGPMTGRRAGHCAGAGVPGFFGRGRGGGGGGGGRGWCHMYRATGLPGWARVGAGAVDPSEGVAASAGPQTMTERRELDALKQQARQAADVLASVQQRINELDAGAAS